jgi:hypothetical protein
MARRAVRIAGFVFAGTVALMGQTVSNNPEAHETQLVAMNAVTTPHLPATMPSVPSVESQPSNTTPQPATQVPAPDLRSKTLLPAASTPALAQERVAGSSRTRSSRPWLNAGPDALPSTARMDPLYDPPAKRYGAAPAAVQFSFGRK